METMENVNEIKYLLKFMLAWENRDRPEIHLVVSVLKAPNLLKNNNNEIINIKLSEEIKRLFAALNTQNGQGNMQRSKPSVQLYTGKVGET
jgi:hypothetical protein